MRVHHRVPSIFNLSMVDVLCCALGCVILLWLLNLREAKQHEAEARDHEVAAGAATRRAESERDSAYLRLKDLGRQLDEQTSAARAAGGQLEAARLRLAELERAAAAADARAKALQAVADAVPGLRSDLKEARDRSLSEEAMAKGLEKEVARRTRELTEAGKTLQALQAARQTLEQDLARKEKELVEKETELAAARAYKGRYEASAGRAAELEKLAEERGKAATTAKVALEVLEEEKAALRAEAARYRQSADNRFAGIQLTGRRVVFVVDMSGSMELIDEKTPAPAKWPGVRETLAKVMRSLPGLEQFQVIIFSERASFLLGNDNRWIDYDPKATPERVLAALSAVKPNGGTNMYAALEATFRFRARGLDTVYLFSDGLPNLGEGLTPQQARTLKEAEQGDVLGKYIRRKLRAEWNFAAPGRPKVRINAVGFFYESPDVGAFLWALARENDGSFVGMSKP